MSTQTAAASSSNNTTPQRVFKSSGSCSKNGPMRAILPMSSLVRQQGNNNIKRASSPSLSPISYWRIRISPDAVSSSGLRSPGATYRGKSRSLYGKLSGVGNTIRRTASLDAIYLKCQLPAEGLRMYCGHLLVDKATQTSDEWMTGEYRKTGRFIGDFHTNNEDKLDKFLRHKQRGGSREGNKFNPITGDHNVFSSLCSPTSPSSPSSSVSSPVGSAISIPNKPTVPKIRNSIEGLNQEIERLVLKASIIQDQDENKACQATPEGHRAPLAEILRSTRSVNTQTPAGGDFIGSTPSSGPPSCGSVSPLITGHLELSGPPSEAGGGSPSSSPEQEGNKLGTSPHINKFLAREPPDGCEKVCTKTMEDLKGPRLDLSKMDYCPLKPSATFQLRPSLCSAFQPLCRTPVPDDLETSSHNTDDIDLSNTAQHQQ